MSDAQLAPLILAGIATLLGSIFLGFGLLRARMTRSWTQTTGVIINRRDGGTRGMPALYPTFQWRDQHGQDHQRTSIVKSSLGPKPGKLIPVLYDPSEPSRAVIDSLVQSGRIFKRIGIGILALGFAALAIFLAVTFEGRPP